MASEATVDSVPSRVETDEGALVYVHERPSGGVELLVANAESDRHTLTAQAARALAKLLNTAAGEPQNTGPSPGAEPQVHELLACGQRRPQNTGPSPGAEPPGGTGAETTAPENPPPGPRRRETVSDLLSAELLHPGDVLTMPRHGVEHRAVVLSDGKLQTSDGKAFDTPSPAAAHVAKSVSEPGWDVWRTARGVTLADLRWDLRVREFPPDAHKYSDSYINEMRMVALRWVQFAAARGTTPARRDESAVEAFLDPEKYAASTIASYRRHLECWFELYGTTP